MNSCAKTHLGGRFHLHVHYVYKLNLPKYFEAISIARSGIPISRSAFTKVDHVGTSRFIQAVSISCLQVLVVWMSRHMVIRTDSGTLGHIPRRNQSLTPCSSLTRSDKGGGESNRKYHPTIFICNDIMLGNNVSCQSLHNCRTLLFFLLTFLLPITSLISRLCNQILNSGETNTIKTAQIVHNDSSLKP